MIYEAIVLGSGTSSGVPVLGIEYPASFLSNPKNHRTRSSLLLRGPDGNVIVDCTPDMRSQLLRENIADVNAAIITHGHADHVMGMDDLRAFSQKYKRAFPVYAGPETQSDILRIYPYAFQMPTEGIEVPRYELLDVTDPLDLCGMKIENFWVMHGPIRVLGIRLGDFAFLTDVNEIPEAAWHRLLGLRTLIMDAVRYRPHPNHFHFEKALEVAAQLGAETTYFTHLSHDYDHDAVEATLPKSIRLAYDGLRVGIECG